MANDEEGGDREERDLYLIPRLETMRLLNGWSMSKLAQEAKVDRDTIKKIEKKHGVSDYIAARVYAAVSAKLLPEYQNKENEIKKADSRARHQLKAVHR
jgi:DNA-binding XRE family transcriptional regulator